MVVRDADNQEWKRIENSPAREGTIIVDDGGKSEIAAAGTKRTRTLSTDDTPAAKKPRASSSSLVTTSAECIAPPPNPLAQAFFYPQESDRSVLSSGDIFLSEGFRDRWCRCAKVDISVLTNNELPSHDLLSVCHRWNHSPSCYARKRHTSLQKIPIQVNPLVSCILHTSSVMLGLSLEELGMRALERLPRDRAIEGIHAYNGMK